MTTTEQLDAYFGQMHMQLLAHAAEGYRVCGRGALLVGWSECLPPLCSVDYVPLGTLEAWDFSSEFLEFVRTYNPESEGIVYVKLGESAKMLKLEVQRGEVFNAVNN